MEQSEMPPLLSLLVQTLDDERLFVGHFDRVEAVLAWQAIYETAAFCWRDALTFGVNEGEAWPEPFGVEMFRRYPYRLGLSGWLAYADAIVRTAERDDLPGENDRKFLYFMLGCLTICWRQFINEDPFGVATAES